MKDDIVDKESQQTRPEETPLKNLSGDSEIKNIQDSPLKPPSSEDAILVGEPKIKSKSGSPFEFLKKLSKKQIIIICVSFGVLIAAGVIFVLTKPDPKPPVVVQQVKPEPKPDPKPEPIISPLTGRIVTQAEKDLPVTAIMIENSPDARPQSGLQQADAVYEAIAEGGITRFLTLFQESQPDYIGPVRSVRPYYLDFLVPYDAAIAHVGGSAQALAEIQQQGIKDLDQSFNPNYYHRVSDRYAPHNTYTSRAELLQLHNEKGFTSSTYSSFKRKADKPATAETPGLASKVDVNMSSYTYNASFIYDKASNSYLRTMAGEPHVDERTGKQINPKVVIVPVMSHGYAGIYSVYGNVGEGKVFIFQDGTVQTGTWKKAGRSDQLQIFDVKNKELKINAGQTWITLAGAENQVVITP